MLSFGSIILPKDETKKIVQTGKVTANAGGFMPLWAKAISNLATRWKVSYFPYPQTLEPFYEKEYQNYSRI